MNYGKVYFSIIENAKAHSRVKLSRNNLNFIYYEKHHIIPVCMGGKNNSDNLVLLTAKEHFICHVLLTKMYPANDSLILACQAMTMIGGRERFSGRVYKSVKERQSSIASKRQQGRKLSQETKDKIGKTAKGKNAGNNNATRRPEVALKISKAKKGKSNGPMSQETKDKISKSNKGNTGKFFKKSNPGTICVSCISCKKEITLPSLGRWHKNC